MMKKTILCFILFFSFLVVLPGCDHGLEPTRPVQPGFQGTISFRGTWPADTLEMRLIASQVWRPFNSFSDIIALLVNTDSVKVYPPPSDNGLPMGRDSLVYNFTVPPSTYRYVALALRFGTNYFADWRIIGVYDGMNGSQIPAELVVPADRIVSGADILVDFNNPPPQPFAGGHP